MRLRVATCRPLPEPDVDEGSLLAALRARGIDVRLAAWNDPEEQWSEPVPTVIRSTWDYIHDLRAFRAWIERASSAAPLWNPSRIVLENLHKGYLLALDQRGIDIVPTALVTSGSGTRLVDVLRARRWDDVVVKPAVGAGSFGTLRFRADEHAAGERHFASLVCEGDVLVQPYERSVEGHGERALVWIDGEFTHAVRIDQ